MLKDDFKQRYTTIPFATYTHLHRRMTRDHIVNTLTHLHREMELLWVQTGAAQVSINGKTYPVSQGDMIFVPPYALHHTTIYPDRDFGHQCLCFDLSLLGNEALRSGLESGHIGVTPVVHDGAVLGTLVENAFRVHAQGKPGWEMQVIGSLSLMFGLLQEQGHLSPGNRAAEKTLYYPIMRYIETHFQQNITSTDAAKHLCISGSHFCRLFKHHFGCRFQNYLCAYRIERAKLLLSGSDLSVTEVASQCGFNSSSYFTSQFRLQTGKTPSDYRCEYAAKNP